MLSKADHRHLARLAAISISVCKIGPANIYLNRILKGHWEAYQGVYMCICVHANVHTPVSKNKIVEFPFTVISPQGITQKSKLFWIPMRYKTMRE